MIPALTVFPDQRALAEEAGRFIVLFLQKTIAERGRANMVLSGGRTPRAVYELLPSLAREVRLDWRVVDLFWGDERSVPPDHPESNFRMVQESLLRHVEIPGPNIHRIRSEHGPAQAAALYTKEIRNFFGLTGQDIPSFDLLLLGLGPDGHIASVFPGTTAEEEGDLLVTAVRVEKLLTDRITMTLPLLNNAAMILLLVSGKEKAGVLKIALHAEGPALPVHRLRPVHGELRWFADSEAAGMLDERSNG